MELNKYDENEESSSAFSVESFLESLKDRVSEGDKIENEGQLRIARAKQKMDHKERRLEAELVKKGGEIEELKIDRQLKIIVAAAIFALLFLETIALFVILFFQGFNLKGFFIDNTTLNIFAPATILQISSMAIIITKYLFSSKK